MFGFQLPVCLVHKGLCKMQYAMCYFIDPQKKKVTTPRAWFPDWNPSSDLLSSVNSLTRIHLHLRVHVRIPRLSDWENNVAWVDFARAKLASYSSAIRATYTRCSPNCRARRRLRRRESRRQQRVGRFACQAWSTNWFEEGKILDTLQGLYASHFFILYISIGDLFTYQSAYSQRGTSRRMLHAIIISCACLYAAYVYEAFQLYIE